MRSCNVLRSEERTGQSHRAALELPNVVGMRRWRSVRTTTSVGLGLLGAMMVGDVLLTACGSGVALPLTSVAPGAPATDAPARATPSAGPQHGTVRWRRSLEGPVSQGPVISGTGAGATVYVGSGGGVLHAIDPETGVDRWTFATHTSFGGDLTTSAAVLADGTVLWPGPRDRLYVLDSSGHLLATEQRASVVLTPAVAGAADFYLAEASGALSAYRVEAGHLRRRWTVDLGDVSYGSPVVGPDGSLRETVDDSVVALADAGDHAVQVWRFAAHDISEVSAAVTADGTTVFGTNDGAEYGLTVGGDVAWKVTLSSFTYSSPVVTAAGLAYFGDNNGVVYVVRTSDGRVERRLQAPARGKRDESSLWSSPAVDSRGDVYYGTRDGSVVGFTATGRQLFTVSAPPAVYSTPVLTPDGALVVGTQANVLLCIADVR